MRVLKIFTLILGVILLISSAMAEFKKAPASQVSQAITQACLFEKSISAQSDISIYVMGNQDIVKALKAYQGQNLGNVKLAKLEGGSGVPANKPTILILGNPDLVGQASSYCQENGVLSMTNLPKVLKKGISFGIGVNGSGAPALLLNPKQTAKEGKNWNPAIMKMATIVK